MANPSPFLSPVNFIQKTNWNTTEIYSQFHQSSTLMGTANWSLLFIVNTMKAVARMFLKWLETKPLELNCCRLDAVSRGLKKGILTNVRASAKNFRSKLSTKIRSNRLKNRSIQKF